MTAKCLAIAKSGNQCRVPALTGKQHCLMHDPSSVEARREAGRKGGKARGNQARAAKLLPLAMAPEELGGWLSLLFKQVMTGRIEPKIATAAAAVARVMMDVRAATELEQRLTELEQRAGVTDQRRRA